MSSNVAGGGGLGANRYQQRPQQDPMQNPYVGQQAPSQYAPGMGDEEGHEGHGHSSILYKISESPRNRGMFLKGSLGIDAGEDFNMAAGKGFKDKAGRDPNDNDQAQNNLTKADANHGAWGIPKYVAGTRDKPNYVQGIQVGSAISLMEVMAPDMLEVLIERQNAGRGSVWNGAAFMLGLIDDHDGSAEGLEGYRDDFMNSDFLDSGETLADIAAETKDSQGNNWARTNHKASAIKAFVTAYEQGIPWDESYEAITDNTVSGAGRIDTIMAKGKKEYASNNQENTFTGMNADERAEWKNVSQMDSAPQLLRILMDSHTMGSHLLTQFGNEGAESKITGNLGLKAGMDVEQRKGKLVEFFMNNEDDPHDGKKAKRGPYRYTPMQSPGQYPGQVGGEYGYPGQKGGYPGQVGGEYGYPGQKRGYPGQVGGEYGYPGQRPTQAGGHAHGGGGEGEVGGASGGGGKMPPSKYSVGGGGGAPNVALGGGCNMDHSTGAGLVGGAAGGGAGSGATPMVGAVVPAPGAVAGAAGGGAAPGAAAPAAGAVPGQPVVGGGDIGSLAAVLQQLVTVLNQVVAALSASGVAGVQGGGAPGKPVQGPIQGPYQGPYQGPSQYGSYPLPPRAPAQNHAGAANGHGH